MIRISIIIIMLISYTAAQSGFEIATMVDKREVPSDIISKTTMLLTNSKDKTRTSTILSKSSDNGSKQILWFLAPVDDKGVAFLKIEHDNKSDEMRMWLPAFKKVRRISSSKKGDSFMGSDLSYEDMTSRDLEENSYKRLEDDVLDGSNCFVIEVLPNEDIKSTYSKHITWIDKKSLIAVQEESYDLSGELRKKKQFFFDSISGYDIINKIFVEDVQKNHTTTLTMEDIRVHSGLHRTLFQEKNLKRMPRD